MDMCSSLPLCLHLPLLRLKQVPKPTPGMETMPMATMEGLVTSSACSTVSDAGEEGGEGEQDEEEEPLRKRMRVRRRL